MSTLLTFAAIVIAMLAALMVLIHEAPVMTSDGGPARSSPSYINGIGCSLAVACALFLGAQVL